MKILLLNHYAGSPEHGMEYRPYYLAREWVRLGHEVMMIAASYSHVRSTQPCFSGPRLDETLDGIEYRWYSTPEYDGNGIGRVMNLLFIRSLWRDARKSRMSLSRSVIASSTYPMDIWPARRIANHAGADLIYEVHDLWPLSPIEIGRIPRWHPFIVWVQYAEDFAYRHANKVISMLPKTLDHMLSRGMKSEKFAHVPNGIDPDEWRDYCDLPEDVSVRIGELRERGLPIVGYAGTHGLANALDVLIDAAKQLKNVASILLVGKGPERNRLYQRTRDEQISNVLMLPPLPKKCIPALLESLDIAYIGWHANPLYRFGISPNKLLDYMMAALPIVHSVEAGNDPVAEAGCGLTVPPDDAEQVARAVCKLVEMPAATREALGASGRNYVLHRQTYPVLARKFLGEIGWSDEAP